MIFQTLPFMTYKLSYKKPECAINHENNVEKYKFGTRDIVTIVMNGMSHSAETNDKKTTSIHTHTIHKND